MCYNNVYYKLRRYFVVLSESERTSKMADYTGAECLSCGKKFESGDDIVVCPECGTPYHRECYLKEGKCINTELHENGQSWSKGSSQEQSEDSIRCIRCGAENPADKIF